jgi:6,7-dimethyl-8-ribityllumazine synthase
MSGQGRPDVAVDGRGLRVAVVAASWHEQVMDGLVAGAVRGLTDAGIDAPEAATAAVVTAVTRRDLETVGVGA